MYLVYHGNTHVRRDNMIHPPLASVASNSKRSQCYIVVLFGWLKHTLCVIVHTQQRLCAHTSRIQV